MCSVPVVSGAPSALSVCPSVRISAGWEFFPTRIPTSRQSACSSYRAGSRIFSPFLMLIAVAGRRRRVRRTSPSDQ